MSDPSEPGHRGVLDVIEWHEPGDVAIVRIMDPNNNRRPIIYGVIESPDDQSWASRPFLTVEKDYVHRYSIMVVFLGPGQEVKVKWHIDIRPYDLSPRDP